MKHKVTWNQDSIDGNNESILPKSSDRIDDAKIQNDEDVKDTDTIQKLRNLSFTMMAAELFYICCCRKEPAAAVTSCA